MVRGKGYIMAAKGIFSRRENAQQYKMQWGAPVKWASKSCWGSEFAGVSRGGGKLNARAEEQM